MCFICLWLIWPLGKEKRRYYPSFFLSAFAKREMVLETVFFLMMPVFIPFVNAF